MAISADDPHPLTGDTLPVRIGHEFAGTVIETGDGVDAIAEGDAVVVNPILGCGECQYCLGGTYALCESVANIGIHGRSGGFAERAVVPADNVAVLPATVPIEYGALVEPLAIGMHAVRRSGLSTDDTAVVFGAGPIGMAVLQSAVAAGTSEVYLSEPRAARRELAIRLGATETIDPTEVDPVGHISATTGGGTHTAFEVAGDAETLTQAIRTTRKGGMTVIVSVYETAPTLDPNLVMMAERDVLGSYGYRAGPSMRRGEFGTVIRMIQDGRLTIEPMITGRIALEDIVEQGFERLRDPDSGHVKLLVEP